MGSRLRASIYNNYGNAGTIPRILACSPLRIRFSRACQANHYRDEKFMARGIDAGKFDPSLD